MFESLFESPAELDSAPIVRTPAEQAEADKATQLLILYHYESCWFCARVRRIIDQLHLNIEKRDIQQSAEHRQTLVDGGGRATVPCLRIEERDGQERWMYDSAVIIEYLSGRFGRRE